MSGSEEQFEGTEEERETFEAGSDSMQQGFSGKPLFSVCHRCDRYE
jgi:hypothetical protein